MWAWVLALNVAAVASASADAMPAGTQPAVSRPAGPRFVYRPASRPASTPTSVPAAAAKRPALARRIRVRLLDDVSAVLVDVDTPVDLIDADTHRPLGEAVGGVGPAVFELGEIRFPALQVAFPSSRIDLVPRGGQGVAISLDGRPLRFPGGLRLVRGADRLGSVLNVLDVEDYLPGVVAAELDRRFHREAMRAQAIAARTFAWYQMRTVGRLRDYDVTATTGTQVYQDLGRVEEVPEALAAVRDTTGLVCTWNSPVGDRIFCAYYCSACGGWTQSADAIIRGFVVPPLAGDVACEFCQEADRFQWGPVPITKADLAARLVERYERFAAFGPIQRVEVRQATAAGRPVVLALSDAEGRVEELEVERFRLALDPAGRQIRSSFFAIQDAGDAVVLMDGRGFGHGVGLCQHGAEALARRGFTVSQILQHYYPASKLRRAY